MLLTNPFTPSEIASSPSDFFGRLEDLATLERSLSKGSVAIQGPIGIGKSSLLTRGRLLMEGFDSRHRCHSLVAVGDKDVQTVDHAARLVLESFVEIDQRETKVTFKIGNIFESSSAELCRYFSDGRHLAALKRVVERKDIDQILARGELLILAIDEADKCPIPLARLIRAISTHTQQQGVQGVRFLLAGVAPFFQAMVDEDQGVSRFFYKTITLEPLPRDDSTDLVETKLMAVARDAEAEGTELSVASDLTTRIVALANGHPHLLQLLGSHVVENEQSDPDGVLDYRDLMGALRRICYEDRARVYDSVLHLLEVEGKREYLDTILERMTWVFPSRIDKRLAVELVGKEAVHWLVEHDVLAQRSDDEYGLVDEFIRVRLLLDQAESEAETRRLEEQIVEGEVQNREVIEEEYDDEFRQAEFEDDE